MRKKKMTTNKGFVVLKRVFLKSPENSISYKGMYV